MLRRGGGSPQHHHSPGANPYDRQIAEARRRLDRELVRRELAPSREAAQALIADGAVLVNGAVAAKAARQVLPGDAIIVTGAGPRFVSRGGDKLEEALTVFGIDPSGCRCLDIGSSTGGFTDCLLQHGAESVEAVDVGTHQLHERLRADERVGVREQTDIRSVSPAELGGPFDVVVCDVSFIGLGQIIDTLLAMVAPSGVAVVLVKPQFEAGRAEASKGKGVIADPVVWRRVLGEVVATIDAAEGVVTDACVSPIKGGSGNVEFLFAVRHHFAEASRALGSVSDARLDALVALASDGR